jgi:hypothetical protein
LGELEAEVVVESDEAAIEGGVVEAGEGESVANVEALGGVGAPREDVGGDEEFADDEVGDAAARAEVVEDGAAEVFLSAADFDAGDGFGGPVGGALMRMSSLGRTSRSASAGAAKSWRRDFSVAGTQKILANSNSSSKLHRNFLTKVQV